MDNKLVDEVNTEQIYVFNDKDHKNQKGTFFTPWMISPSVLYETRTHLP